MYFPDFISAIADSDVALGSRELGVVNVLNWDFKRLILSKLATEYVKIVTGLRLSDTTGGFKCWRRTTLEAMDLERVFSNGYLFQIETTYQAHRMGFRISEVPIIFYERDFGRSKIDFNIITEALCGVIKLRLMGGFGVPARKPAVSARPFL